MVPAQALDDREYYITKYTESIIKEIDSWLKRIKNIQIKTIFFGWWTPLVLWKDNLVKIIDKLKDNCDLQYLEEMSFELNPFPMEQNFDFINSVNLRYKDFFRIRYSFGLQSFDDEILSQSNRGYSFNNLVVFLRELRNYKEITNVFNFDFIAFWKFNQDKSWNKILRDKNKLDFFQKFVNSLLPDSFSLYTMELFPWSNWYNTLKRIDYQYWDDNIYDEFNILKDVISSAGYKRYEISNFALSWRESVHNMSYWNMWNYLWLWVWWYSFFDKDYLYLLDNIVDLNNKKDISWVRFSNVKAWDKYFDWKYIDKKDVLILTDKDYKIEKFFLWLRTCFWIDDYKSYKDILVKDFENKIISYVNEWYLILRQNRLILTDRWMDVYNEIITNLIQEF